MYDINTKVIKKGIKFYLIFFVVGILFLVIMLAVIINTANKKNSLDGEIVSTHMEVSSNYDGDSTTYKPTYYYSVNGDSYTCTASSSSSIYPKEGAKVYYDTKEPSKCLTEYDTKANTILYIALLIPIACIVVAVLNFSKINKRIKIVNELNQTGKLVKGLPYRLEDTGMKVNNRPIRRPVVDYVLATGSTVTLKGDPRHDNKEFDEDGKVDLVIDENNPEKYFIDFEINRLTGNTPSDYYSNSKENNQNSVYNGNNQYNNGLQENNQYQMNQGISSQMNNMAYPNNMNTNTVNAQNFFNNDISNNQVTDMNSVYNQGMNNQNMGYPNNMNQSNLFNNQMPGNQMSQPNNQNNVTPGQNNNF